MTIRIYFVLFTLSNHFIWPKVNNLLSIKQYAIKIELCVVHYQFLFNLNLLALVIGILVYDFCGLKI